MRKTRTGTGNKNPKPIDPKAETLFTFRLPVDYMQWFTDHAPEADSRHLRMQAFVVRSIRENEGFTDARKDELTELKERLSEVEQQVYYSRDEIRDYIANLMRDNGRLNTMQQVSTEYQDGDIPDDLIDNMLEGLGR